MANQLNEFDKMIKESLDGYEAPYDQNQWEELEEELNIAAPGLTSYFASVTTGLVLTGMVFIGMLLFNNSYFNSSPTKEEIVVVDNNSGKITETAKESAPTGLQNSIQNIESDPDETGVSQTESPSNIKISDTEENVNPPASTESDVVSETNTSKDKNSNLQGANSNNADNSEIEISEADNSPKIRTGCTGMTIDFNASEEYGKNAHFLWNFGDGYFSNDANPSHTFNKEGVFDVSLSVTSPASGQITSNVVQAMIEVVEAPIANLEFNIDSPEVIQLSNKSYNAADIQWRVDDEIVSAKSEISVSLADNTHYQLALIAYNEGGCSDTLQAEINSIIAGSEFPKAYETSYGTSFAPGAIIDDGTVASIKIFEQATGKLVFEGSGSKGWEGNDLNGTNAQPGKYEWVMQVNKSEAIDIYRGKIQLR